MAPARRQKTGLTPTSLTWPYKFVLLWIAAGAILTGLWGCAAPGKGADWRAVRPTITGSSDSYYYYMMAILEWRHQNLDAAVANMDKAVTDDPKSAMLRKELIRLHIEKRDLKSALKEIYNLQARHPKNAESYVMLGSIYEVQNNIKEAVLAYKKAIALDPNLIEVYFRLADIHQKNNEPKKALQTYEALLKTDPESFGAWFFLGKLHASQKKPHEAARCFEEALKRKPNLNYIRLDLIDVYEVLGDDDKAVALYKEMAASDPDDIFPPLGLAHFYLKRKQLQKAQEVLDLARARHANDPLFEKKIGGLYLDMGYYDKASEIYSKLHARLPRDGEISYFLAMTLEGLEKNQEAAKIYREVPKNSQHYHFARVYLAFLTKDPQDIKQAIAILENSNNKGLLTPELMVLLGNLYEKIKDYDKAAGILSAAIEQDPNNASALFYLGMVYDKQGKKQDCIKTMKLVLELTPDDPNALNYLGYTYADLGVNLDHAEVLIIKALEKRPKDGYILDSLGWVYFKMEKYEKALLNLKKASDLAPGDPTITEHLGDAYLKAKDIKSALSAYRKALNFKKKGEDAKTLKDKIRALEK